MATYSKYKDGRQDWQTNSIKSYKEHLRNTAKSIEIRREHEVS
jgi:hypothetical protein